MKLNRKQFIALFAAIFALMLICSSCNANSSATEQRISRAYTATDPQKYLSDENAELSRLIEENARIDVLVELQGENVLDGYFKKGKGSLTEFAASPEAAEIADALLSEQSDFIGEIEEAGIDYRLRNRISFVANVVSLNIPAAQFETLSSLKGTGIVAICDVYETTATNPEDLAFTYGNNEYTMSSDMLGITEMRENGYAYDGKGTIIAVIDSGIHTSHEAFTTIMPTQPVLTEEELEKILPYTTAYSVIGDPSLSASDYRINDKIAFCFDYADSDRNVKPSIRAVLNYAGAHGTHVAGLAAGNSETFKGTAPDAQILALKVFGDNSGGAASDSILAALNDAVLLGSDVINMSLGSSAGFSSDASDVVNAVYERIRKLGITLVSSAGNAYSSAAYLNSTNLAYTKNPDYSTVSSASSYNAGLSVASINSYAAKCLTYGGNYNCVYGTAVDTGSNAYDSLGILLGEETERTLEYAVVGGKGEPSDYEGINVNGKIALVMRGGISFYDKAVYAKEAGATAIIIYDNGANYAVIGAQMEEMPLPVFTVRMRVGESMAECENKTVTFGRNMSYSYPFMSDFSSWGATPDLKLKPDVTAPGGNVISTVIENAGMTVDTYGYMSGTSMASPNLAGLMLNVRQYLRETQPELPEPLLNKTAYQIVMSTALIVTDEYGNPYSPRKQGSGLANGLAATTTPAYISVSGSDFAKIELGDDPLETGRYTLDFDVVNMSEKEISYDLSSVVMTDYASADGIYSEQRGYVLDKGTRAWYTDGTENENAVVTVAPKGRVSVTLVITLSEEEKAYISDNFANGSYVEGFVKLNSDENPSLSVPFLAFFGDWGDAEIFDVMYYDETQPDTFRNYLVGTVGTSNVYLGVYPYKLPEGTDSPEVTEDMVAVSGKEYSLSTLAGLSLGLKRNIGELGISITDTVTGEPIDSSILEKVRKVAVRGSTVSPTLLSMSLNAIAADFPNNGSFTLTFTAKIDYDYTEKTDSVSFVFHVDFEAPVFNDIKIEKGPDGRIYVKADIFENRYLMDFQIYNYDIEKGTVGSMLTDYMIPVTSPVYGSNSLHVIDVTDAINAMEGDYIGFFAEDYAFNKSGFSIEIDDRLKAAAAEFKTENEKTNCFASTSDILRTMSVTTSADENGFVIENGVLISYSGSDAEIIIPSSVTKIADSVFKGNTVITKVTLPENLVSVGAQAFMGCTKLTEISMPDTVIEIGTECFSGCKAVKTAKLSSALKNISDKAFYNCEALTSVIWPSAYERIGDSAFYKCTKITSLSLPESVRRIEDNAFYSTKKTAVTKLALPENLEYIGTNAFRYLGVGELIIPDCYEEELFENAEVSKFSPFYYCQATKVVMPSGWTRIPDYLCYYMTKLKSIEFPDGITEIGVSSFFNCTAITEIVIPDSVVTLGSNCFAYCKGVKKLVIPEGIENLPDRLLDQSQITTITIPSSVVTIGSQCFHKSTKLTEVVFAQGSRLETIGANAFNGCTSLTSFVMPDTVTSVGTSALAGNTKLKELHISESLVEFVGINPLANSAIEEIVFPESYTGHIGSSQVCGNMKKLKKATFRNNIISVSNTTFLNCTALETVVFEKNVQYALAVGSGLTSLREIEFKGSIKQLYGRSFYQCLNLKSVSFNDVEKITGYVGRESGIENITFNGNVGSIELYAFQHMPELKEIVLNGNLGHIGEYVFYDYETVNKKNYGLVGPEYLSTPNVKWVVGENNPYLTLDENGVLYNKEKTRLYKLAPGISIEKYIMPDSVVTVDNGAFAGRSDIKEIVLGKGFTQIPDYAFSAMSNLRGIDISSVTSLGKGVFKDCVSLESISFGSEITVVGSYLLSGCTSLKSVTFASKPTIIGDYAFENTAIESFTDTEKLLGIGEGAFMGCKKLVEFAFPDSLSIIGDGAFMESGIVEAILGKETSYIGKMAFAHCKSLEKVFIPESTKEFRFSGVFKDCTKLVEVIVDENNLCFVSENGVIYDKDKTVLHFYPSTLKDKYFRVPEGIVKIDANAFFGNEYLITVELPSTLEVIGDKAFFGCSSLSTVIINSEKAPVLEALYDENRKYYYSNFVGFIGEIEKSLTLYCVNAELYDNYVWKSFFKNIYELGNSSNRTDSAAKKLSFLPDRGRRAA